MALEPQPLKDFTSAVAGKLNHECAGGRENPRRQVGAGCMNILPSCLCASCSNPSPGQPACILLPCQDGHPVAVLLILVGFSHGVGVGRTANVASMRPVPIFFTPRRLAKSEHAQCSFPHQASTSISLAKARHTSEPRCCGPCSLAGCRDTEALLLTIMSSIPNWAAISSIPSNPCAGKDSKLNFCSPGSVSMID